MATGRGGSGWDGSAHRAPPRTRESRSLASERGDVLMAIPSRAGCFRRGALAASLVAVAAILAVARLHPSHVHARSRALQMLATQLERLHPQDGATGFPAFAHRIVSEAVHPMPAWRYWLLADELTRYFGDPHTALGPIRSTRHLPLAFYWVQGGMVVLPLPQAPRAIEAGDAVVAIGGQSPSHMATALSRLLSGNRYWVRVMGRSLLSTGYGLHWLHLLGSHNRVSMTLRRPNGVVYHVSVPLLPASKAYAAQSQTVVDRFVQRFRAPAARPTLYSESAHGAFFSWGIARDGQYGVFVLGTCVDDAAYRHAVQQFFAAMHARHIPRAVIDLQDNFGGNSAVVKPCCRSSLRRRAWCGTGTTARATWPAPEPEAIPT